MLFPLNAEDGDIFTSSNGQDYKWQDIAYAWIKSHTVTTIPYLEQPKSVPVNVGDFNIANDNSSAETYVFYSQTRIENPYNNASHHHAFNLERPKIDIGIVGDFNIANDNSSTELYVLATNTTNLDNFNASSYLSSVNLERPKIDIGIVGDFNITNSAYSLQLTI